MRRWLFALLVACSLALLPQAGGSLPMAGLPAGPLDALGASDLAAPAAPSAPRLVRVDPVHAAWSVDLGLSLAAGQGTTTPTEGAKSACPLGDVDGDGHDDLLVRHKPGQQADHARFEALAGPDFTRSLWTAEPRDARLLKCGSDVTGDGVADPIVVADPAPADPAALPSTPVGASDASTTAITPVDGAAGTVLAEVTVDSGSTTVGDAGLVASAGRADAGDVVPAGPGALLVVATAATGAQGAGPLEPAAASHDGAVLQVVDASGDVQGSITIPASADAVAAAPLPAGASEPGGLPDVVVLTETDLLPSDGVPFGVPEIALHDGQGAAQWTARQEATTGVPVLLPDAGDVDGDGVGDLVYATVPADVAVAPSAGYAVVSGADGSTLLSSGEPSDGLATALPLGDVDPAGDGADEVLVVTQPASGGDLTLAATGADGEAAWTAQVPGDAVPVNTATDASGNVVGFTDLTGDGVPDVAVASPAPGGDGTLVTVVSGADGSTAWSESVAGVGVDGVAAVPGTDGGPAQDLVATGTGDGTTSGLLVVALDGASGEAVWETAGEDAGAGPAVSTVEPAGDADGDGIGDLLVTTGAAGPDGAPDPDSPGAAHVVSGGTGESIADLPIGGADAAPALRPVGGAAAGTDGDGGVGAAWPGLLVVLGLAVGGFIAWRLLAARRRRGAA